MRAHRLLACISLVVLLLALSSCITFNDEPYAGFTWEPTTPLARVQVQFTDTSTDNGGLFIEGGITGWHWEFGDGAESHEQNPTHAYEHAGTYRVKLTVHDAQVESDTAYEEITVVRSLEGYWLGRIVDPYGFELDIELLIGHQPDGSFNGVIAIAGEQHPMTAGTFNPTTGDVLLETKGFSLLLAGLLSDNGLVITGVWFDLTSGARGSNWSAIRQN